MQAIILVVILIVLVVVLILRMSELSTRMDVFDMFISNYEYTNTDKKHY